MKSILVIAPHPDDETLGCGGTLLKHKKNGDRLHWLIMTVMSEDAGFSAAAINRRKAELTLVAEKYQFDSVTVLDYPAASLDQIPLQAIIAKMNRVFATTQPEVVYLPFEGDIHSDHKVTFHAAAACCKTFRNGYIKKILSYETLSETDFILSVGAIRFAPNVFIAIDEFLEEKIAVMNIFSSELGEFPFPRSNQAIRALAALRAINAGCRAAEGFMLLKEIDG